MFLYRVLVSDHTYVYIIYFVMFYGSIYMLSVSYITIPSREMNKWVVISTRFYILLNGYVFINEVRCLIVY